jgi:predicted Fe-Mo cluster-binding NifX family protein
MKIGFAVMRLDEGKESAVYDHFGSSPAFLIVDTETDQILALNNRDTEHQHGMCNPISALNGNHVDVMIVGGIGPGALTKLNAMGIRVFRSGAPTVKKNLVLLGSHGLRELSMDESCRTHQGRCAQRSDRAVLGAIDREPETQY